MENSVEINDDKPSALLKDSNEVNNSERKEKILKAVITWYIRDTPLADRKELLEWFFSGSMEKATEHQLKTKHELQEFLPALFENHDDDSTFADKNNRTPLHCCIVEMRNSHYVSADYKLVIELCDMGASIVALDCDGDSPLGIALSRYNMDLVQILLVSCNINLADRNNLGQTALHILIDKYLNLNGRYYGIYKYLVKELLRKGADANQPDQNGLTAVHLAAKKLDIKLLKKFKKYGADLNCRTICGDDLLIIVCKSFTTLQDDESKALELINWLVDLQGFHANVKNNNGFTALHYAAKSTNIDIVDTLMRVGADIHAVANDDTNPLHSAAVASNFLVIKDLMSKNVDYHRRDNVHGFSLIHMAAFSGEPRNCEWLIDKKQLDVDDLGKWQLTPLHVASMLGNAKVVKKLIECGADVYRADDKFHHTALHLASMKGLFATIRGMKACGKELNDDQPSLVDHCFKNHKFVYFNVDYNATIYALLYAGAEVNARDKHDCTPLHYAARQSVGDDIVLVLLNAAAQVDVDVQDNEFSTPLQISFVNNNYFGFINLLTFGSNINDIELMKDEIFQKVRNSHLARRMIVDHLFKLKMAGLPIDESYKRYFDDLEDDDHDYLERHSNFLLELTKMKKRMLTDEVSLYDVLHMHFKRRSTFANSISRKIQHEFPNYYILLKGRCNEAVNRVGLLEPAGEAFEWITGMQWPDICLDNILSFMSNRLLKVLIDAASATE